MKKEIVQAYETIRPDEDAKQRMLNNIYDLTSQENVKRKEEKNMNKFKLELKYLLRVAAVMAVVIAVPTAAYAARIFGLNDVNLGKKKIQVPVEEDVNQDYESLPQKEVEVDEISLQGVIDSPEYKACSEWSDYQESYDVDESILKKIGNEPTGFEKEYGEYLCYTQEMADKIDEICKKYNLKKLGELELSESYEKLCDSVGIGDFMANTGNNGENCNDDGYFYSSGTFMIEGTAYIHGSSACVTDYQFRRSMKGVFDTTTLNIGNIDDYHQWEYTTKNGQKVLLANSIQQKHALIIVEKEKSFIVINVLGFDVETLDEDIALDKEDVVQSIFDMSVDASDSALETLAEMFDFSVIS